MNTYSEERSAPIDLRSLQLSSLKRLLSLNKNTSSDDLVNDDSYVWKILIFDHFCQESLSTIFKVGNLRDENITLHLNLHSQRDKIHGVNTIYYIQPTEANIDKLIEDFAKDLYDSVHINFSYPISNELLGKLSKGIAKYNAFYKLKQVFQHHLNYIASTTNLFDLDMPDVYASIRKPELRPQVIDAISHSIISVLMSLKMLPVITFQSGFAEEVAKRIDTLMNDVISEHHLKNQHEPFFVNQGHLVLINRDIDHTCLLMHPWHYGALIDDILKIRNNKVKLKSAITNNQTEEYDLDYKTDKFWAEKMNTPFPFVIEDIDKELNNWKIEYESMGHKKDTTKIEDITSTLGSALDKVPEMTERKKRIDMHTNLASHLASEIKDRSLDGMFEIESSLIFNRYLSGKEKEEFFQLLTDPGHTSPVHILDKARLISIYLQSIGKKSINLSYSTADPSQKDLDRLEQILSEIYPKLDQKIRNYLEVRRIKPKNQQGGDSTDATDTDPKSIGLKMLRGIAQKVTTHGKGILANVTNLVSGGKGFTSVQLVANIIENKNLTTEGIGHINIASKVDMKDLRKTNDYIVFMVDGGSLNEYQNFCDLGKKLNGNVLYGSSYIYNAQEFLKEC